MSSMTVTTVAAGLLLGGFVKEVVPAFFLGQNVALVVQAIEAASFFLSIGDKPAAVERFVKHIHDGRTRLRTTFTQDA